MIYQYIYQLALVFLSRPLITRWFIPVDYNNPKKLSAIASGAEIQYFKGISGQFSLVSYSFIDLWKEKTLSFMRTAFFTLYSYRLNYWFIKHYDIKTFYTSPFFGLKGTMLWNMRPSWLRGGGADFGEGWRAVAVSASEFAEYFVT